MAFWRNPYEHSDGAMVDKSWLGDPVKKSGALAQRITKGYHGLYSWVNGSPTKAALFISGLSAVALGIFIGGSYAAADLRELIEKSLLGSNPLGDAGGDMPGGWPNSPTPHPLPVPEVPQPAPTEAPAPVAPEKPEPFDPGPKPGVAAEVETTKPDVVDSKIAPESVADYELTDGDGITQAVMKLKANWPAGTPMPPWLENIHTQQDVAEWARLNHFYTPDQVRDSVIMYKGDVVSIDMQGELVLKSHDGTLRVVTDAQGRAMPGSLLERDFSDSVPTELPDGRAAELLTQTAVIQNPPVESFAGHNPWPPETTEYRTWEGMRDFITTYATGDAWKTSKLPVGDYLKSLKFID